MNSCPFRDQFTVASRSGERHSVIGSKHKVLLTKQKIYKLKCNKEIIPCRGSQTLIVFITVQEYKRWMEQTSPTCTTRPRKRQCFQKYFGPDASITPLIMESGRPWCNKLKKQYTKFVRADPSAPPAEAGVDDMDIDGEPNPNIASLRSSSELDVHMDFPDWDGIDVNPTFDNQENETPQMVGSGWTPLQHGLQGSQGRRTPTLTPDVAR